MRAVSIAVSVLALSAGLSAASAQVVSRSISEEPVETTVTQTPDGTIITRRPLGEQAPYATPTYVAPRASTIIETEPDTVDTVTTREVVRRMDTRPVRMETRPTQTRTTTRRTATRPAERQVRREVVRTERQVVRPAERIVLSPAERQVVYRTIVEREVVPTPRVIVPAPNYSSTAPVVAADDDYDDGYVTAQPVYRVGARLPANVPLYAVPGEVGMRVPAAQPYSYAYIGGRAYLVDPATSVIVEDVTQ